jgi:hypothetical protein
MGSSKGAPMVAERITERAVDETDRGGRRRATWAIFWAIWWAAATSAPKLYHLVMFI